MASLYVHIPFCEKKCIYCDFYSVENLRAMDRFLKALEIEIDSSFLPKPKPTFETIFFGGGTPSLLKPSEVEKILNHLHRRFSIQANAEITLETNPGTVDLAKLKGYRLLGVDRLSVGIQSFHEDELQFLSRIHSSNEAKECIKIARRAGFDNVSLDLIFALPNQIMERWQSNLQQAVELEPQHISAYSLIVEEGTPLYRMVANQRVVTVPEELEAEMYEFTIDFLTNHGYEQYEVSNFALPGFHSRHNSNYWNHSNYLGFGPSAHSFWNRKRWRNISSIRKYCENLFQHQTIVEAEELLGKDELLEEEIYLGLRSRGLNLQMVKNHFNVDLLQRSCNKIHSFIQDQLLAIEGDMLLLTKRGFLYCDEIVLQLLQ